MDALGEPTTEAAIGAVGAATTRASTAPDMSVSPSDRVEPGAPVVRVGPGGPTAPVAPVAPVGRPHRRLVRVLIQIVLAAATVAVTVALLRAGWLGDVIGLAMPAMVLGSAAAVALVAAVRPSWLASPVAALVVSSIVVFGPRWPIRTARPVDPVRVVAVNLQFDADHPAATARAALDAVLATPPTSGAGETSDTTITDAAEATAALDAAVAAGLAGTVLVVSELTPETDAIIRTAFPFRITTEQDLTTGRFGQGIYSTMPLVELARPEGIAGQTLRVRVDAATPFVLYAVHLPRPTFAEPPPAAMIGFSGHRAAAFTLDRVADAEELPVVIAGDLNLSDRTSGYRRLSSGRLDASRTGWASSTFDGSLSWSLALLRIDHIFVPSTWCAMHAHSFDIKGSDHQGLTAEIGSCPR